MKVMMSVIGNIDLLLKLIISFLITFTLSAENTINQEQKELQKVSIQLQWLDQFQFAGYYIAKEKGFYKDVGLDVEIKKFNNSISPVNEVVNKKTTYAVGRSSLVINKSDGKDITLLASIFQSSPLMLLTTKDSGIKHIKDFKYKRLMYTPDAAEAASLHAMINKYGINKRDMILQTHSFDINDLIDNNTDLLAAYISNEPYILKQKGIKSVIFHPKDYGFDFYSDILFTSGDEIKNNPQRARNFTNASLRGWEYAFSHIDETVELILKKYNSQNKTKEALVYEANELKKLAYHKIKRLGDIDKHKIQRIYDIYNLLGYVKNKINMDNFVFHDDIDDIKFTKEEREYLKNKKELIVCIKKDWLPYESFENGKFIGMSADYLNIYASKLSIPLKVIISNGQLELLETLKQKKCDIKPMIGKQKGVTIPYKSTQTHITDKLVLVTAIEQPFVDDLHKLSQTVLMAEGFHRFINHIKKEYPNIKIKEIKNIDAALRLVANGKAYGYIGTSLVAAYKIQKQYTTKLKIMNDFTKIELGVGVIDYDPRLLSILNKVISKTTIKEKRKVLNNWIATTVEKETDYTFVWHVLSIFIAIIITGLFFIIKQSKLQQKLKETNDKLIKSVLEVSNESIKAHHLNITLDKRVKKEVQKNIQNELKLLEQTKMAAMGEMIGNIAHQWRQPLASISSAVMVIKFKIQSDKFNLENKDDRDNLFDIINKKSSNIEEYVHFLSDTINTFRDFLKEKKEIKEIVVQERIDTTVNIIRASLKNSHITLKRNIDYDDPIKIITVACELSQVIINIINNAKDILIEREIAESWIKISLKQENGKAIITIEDNGGGILEEIMPKIFDPYFTTKHQSQGTGLGLHMSYKIVKDSLKGDLYVKNTNNGAKFFIELPI